MMPRRAFWIGVAAAFLVGFIVSAMLRPRVAPKADDGGGGDGDADALENLAAAHNGLVMGTNANTKKFVAELGELTTRVDALEKFRRESTASE